MYENSCMIIDSNGIEKNMVKYPCLVYITKCEIFIPDTQIVFFFLLFTYHKLQHNTIPILVLPRSKFKLWVSNLICFHDSLCGVSTSEMG